MSGARPKRVVVIDDSPTQCAWWRNLLSSRYGSGVRVETYVDPVAAVTALGPDIHLLLLDWEMPGLDGMAMLERARGSGVNLKRIIIASARPAAELHQVFDRTGCLAVIEKNEPEQHAACLMILDSIMKR